MLVWELLNIAYATETSLRVPLQDLSVGQTIHVHVDVIDPRSPIRPTLGHSEGLSLRYLSLSTAAKRGEKEYQTIITYTYELTALQSGKWEIGPVVFAEQKFDDERIVISVTEKSETEHQTLSILADISKTNLFEGEAFVYSLTFENSLSLSEWQWSLPDLGAFQSISGLEMQERIYSVTEDAKTIFVTEVDIPLMAQRSGQYIVEGTVGQARVVVDSETSESRYGLPAGSHIQKAISDEINLDIQELPAPPDDFSGLVGSFEIDMVLLDTEIDLGDSARLKIIVSGDGLLHPLHFSAPIVENLKTYDNQPIIQYRYVDRNIFSKYELNRVVVPDRDGVFLIEGAQLTFFDSTQEQYVTVSAKDKNLIVNHQEIKTIFNDFSENKAGDSMMGKDIRSPSKGMTPYVSRNTVHWSLFITLFFGLLCGLQSLLRIVSRQKKLRIQIPTQPRERLLYWFERLEKSYGLLRTTDQQQEHQTLRQEALAVLYGGEPPVDIELRIRSFVDQSRGNND